ncbi:MAG: hypothetical protein ACXVZT_08915 [Terriglobales bacterium]
MHSDDGSAKRIPNAMPAKPTAADIASRKQIPPEGVEKGIQDDEKRLETLSGEQAESLRESISNRKEELLRMKAGTLKIFQRIPERS